VVLKACGPRLLHKTEVAGVALDLRSAAEVQEAGRRLLRIQGAQGLLVQEMVPGDRELACGITRKPAFGPCVMLGAGGIFAEAASDAAFRLAPISPEEGQAMAGEIRSAALLGPLRGRAAADTAALGRILAALGEIAQRHPAVAQVDVNPLKVQPDGSLVAVDALVVLGAEAPEASVREPVKDLTAFFEPASAVVVGASGTAGKPGHEVVRNILANG
jgi:succinyl-CoA synthetase beta subunit